jgi:Ca2+-binding EF-hand superfamily protein
MKMKSKTLAIVGLALGLTSSMPLAQAEPGAPGSGAFFEKADQNGDGKITSDEAGEKWDRLSKADKDGDGGVSRQEMASMMGAVGAGAMFEKADANADGKISEAEAGERWERLGKADKDGDGFVNREEFAAAVRGMAGAGGAEGRPDPREFLAKVDKDGNGAFTEDEVPAELWEKISKADANSDGKITPEEIQKARAAAGGEAPGAGGAGQTPKRPPVES